MLLRSGKNIQGPVLLLLFVLLVGMSFLSEGFSGGADNLNHYFISRYSFQHPHLFLDTWGRPLFTIMSSPFSQFGFQGMKLFNILLGCISAYLAFLIARKIGIARAWLAPLFVILTPLFFLMTITGLTEIQFGFILILSVYLFFDERYIASAIVISFLPLSRSEGIVLLPLFFIAYLMKRRVVAIPFLATGILIFSVIGYFFVWKDFFWLFNQSPYPLHHSLYKEEGSLFHFIGETPGIFGLPLLFLFITGTGLYAWQLFTSPKENRMRVSLEIWMLVIPVLLFFAVHSVLFWKAWFGSMGLIRVITGVLPLAAIVSLKAYDQLEKTFLKKKILQTACITVLIILLVLANVLIYHYPVRLKSDEKTVKASTNWIRQNHLEKRLILFTHFYVPYFLDFDPYDKKLGEQVFTRKWLPCYPAGTVFIWDSYFGPTECTVPVSVIDSLGIYRLANIFRPEITKGSKDDPSFEIRVFIRVPEGSHFDNTAIADSIQAKNRFTRSELIKTGSR